jgi:hypothetical protein
MAGKNRKRLSFNSSSGDSDSDDNAASTNSNNNNITTAVAAAAASSSRRAATADGTNSTRSTARINSKSTGTLRHSVAIRTGLRTGTSSTSRNVVETGSARYVRSF